MVNVAPSSCEPRFVRCEDCLEAATAAAGWIIRGSTRRSVLSKTYGLPDQ